MKARRHGQIRTDTDNELRQTEVHSVNHEERSRFALFFSSYVSHPSSLSLLSVLALAAFVIIALLPICVLLLQSVWTDSGFSFRAYASVLADARQWQLLRNTLGIALGTAIVAALLGAPMGCAIEYFRVPTRKALAYALAIPLLIPPYINAIVWIDALGLKGILLPRADGAPSESLFLYSAAGVVFVLALSYFPIVALTTASALRRYDHRLEDPARLAAGRVRVFCNITLPLVVPSVLSGTLFVFVLALVEFATPSLLQVNVYAVEIYSRFSTTYDSAEAMAQAVPLVGCGVLIVTGWFLYLRPRQGRLSGHRRTAEPRPASRASVLAAMACWLLIGLSSVLPLTLLFARSWPMSSYAEVWRTAHEEIASSLLLAALSATVLTGLAAATAYLAHLRRPTARLYALSLLPFLVSGPLVGIGLILIWNHAGIRAWVYDTPAILVLACAARFIFFAHYALYATVRAIPPRMEEAAAVCGVPWWRQATGIVMPLAAPALIGIWGLSFVFSLRELDAAVLVAPPGWNPLSVRLFSLMHYGPSRLVAALSVITVFLVLAGAGVTALAYAKTKRGIDVRR